MDDYVTLYSVCDSIPRILALENIVIYHTLYYSILCGGISYLGRYYPY